MGGGRERLWEPEADWGAGRAAAAATAAPPAISAAALRQQAEAEERHAQKASPGCAPPAPAGLPHLPKGVAAGAGVHGAARRRVGVLLQAQAAAQRVVLEGAHPHAERALSHGGRRLGQLRRRQLAALAEHGGRRRDGGRGGRLRRVGRQLWLRLWGRRGARRQCHCGGRAAFSKREGAAAVGKVPVALRTLTMAVTSGRPTRTASPKRERYSSCRAGSGGRVAAAHVRVEAGRIGSCAAQMRVGVRSPAQQYASTRYRSGGGGGAGCAGASGGRAPPRCGLGGAA